MTATTAERQVTSFALWLWVVIFPLAGLALFLVFNAAYHPAVRSAPKPFSCASQRAESSVLGDGGAIAPLCNEQPYPVAP
jgi:hypothetical protein